MTTPYPKVKITPAKKGYYIVTGYYGKNVVFKQSHIQDHKTARTIATEFITNFKG